MSPAKRTDVVSLGGKSRVFRLGLRFTALAACVALAVIGALPLVGSTNSAAAATQASSATMNFNGALNLLGVLNSLTVSPSQVSIAAGGQVTFANRSGISMTLSVAGQSVSLPASGSRTFGFPGKNSAQTFTATVTPLNVPVLGSATQSSGTVRVAAAPAPSPSSQSPSPSQGNPSQTPSGAANPKSAETPGGQNSSASQNQAKAPDTKWQFGEAPVLLDGNQDNAAAAAAPKSKKDAEANSAASSADAESLGGESWVGLLVVVAAVFLVGVGSAAVRAVIVQRRTALGN